MDNITCNICQYGDITWRYNTPSRSFKHNNNGPAIKDFTGGYEVWYVNDTRHRLDGPAIKWSDNDIWWFINNIRYHNELEYWIAVQNYNKHT